MTRIVPALVAALLLTACGGDDGATATAGDERRGPVANVSLAEAQSYLERGDVALVRQAIGPGRASIETEIEPSPADSRRLEAQNGREFDLLVFATPGEARAAWESLLDTAVIDEGGAAMRAVNLVAVFPEPADEGLFARIKNRLRDVATACGDEDGDPEVRELCFGGETDPVPPSGEGTDSDELAPIGSSVVVGAVTYRVILARQLNPRISPDQELVGDRRPADGNLFFGVVLEACNETGSAPRWTTGRLALVSAFGARARPVDPPDDNAFAYAPERLEPGACVPAPGTVAARALDGRLVLFEIPRDRLQERPLGLQIVSRDGSGRATVALDV